MREKEREGEKSGKRFERFLIMKAGNKKLIKIYLFYFIFIIWKIGQPFWKIDYATHQSIGEICFT